MSWRHQPKVKAQVWGACEAVRRICWGVCWRCRLKILWWLLWRQGEKVVAALDLLELTSPTAAAQQVTSPHNSDS